jgi:hypothetical protein
MIIWTHKHQSKAGKLLFKFRGWRQIRHKFVKNLSKIRQIFFFFTFMIEPFTNVWSRPHSDSKKQYPGRLWIIKFFSQFFLPQTASKARTWTVKVFDPKNVYYSSRPPSCQNLAPKSGVERSWNFLLRPPKFRSKAFFHCCTFMSEFCSKASPKKAEIAGQLVHSLFSGLKRPQRPEFCVWKYLVTLLF